jgi:transposase
MSFALPHDNFSIGSIVVLSGYLKQHYSETSERMRRLKITQPDEVSSALQTEVQSTAHARYLHRLHCVHLVAQGCTCVQVAEWFNEHPRTIERWVQRCEHYGSHELKSEHKGGRHSALSDDQRGTLQRDIQQRPDQFGYTETSWNGRLLGAHLTAQYGLELSVRQCQRLLKQLETR